MNQRSSRRLTRLGFAVFGGLLVASCTLLGTRDVVQCSQDSDCATSLLAKPVVCSVGLCTSRATADAGFDASDAAPDCTRSTDCADEGAICVDNKCTALLDKDLCPFTWPGGAVFRGDNVTLIGFYAPTGNAPNAGPAVAAARLALDQINAGSTKRVVAVLCDANAKRPRDVIGHLAARRIPLVVGQFETNDIASLAQFADDSHVALWSILGNSTLAQSNDSHENVAFLLDELANTASGYQAALNRAERSSNPLVDGGRPDTKVAFLVGPEPEAVALSVRLLDADGGLVVNEKPISAGGDNVQTFNLPLTADQLKPIWQTFHPHVILGLGGNSVLDAVTAIETPGRWGAAPRPGYALSSRSKYDTNALRDLFISGKLSADRARLTVVDFSGDPARHDTFETDISTKVVKEAANFDIAYDAMFVAALASEVPRALDAGAPTAADFTEALKRFRFPAADHASVEVGGNGQYEAARQQILAGKTVLLQGVTGPWTFDPKLPTRRMGSNFLCVQKGQSEFLYYVDSNFTNCEP